MPFLSRQRTNVALMQASSSVPHSLFPLSSQFSPLQSSLVASVVILSYHYFTLQSARFRCLSSVTLSSNRRLLSSTPASSIATNRFRRSTRPGALVSSTMTGPWVEADQFEHLRCPHPMSSFQFCFDSIFYFAIHRIHAGTRLSSNGHFELLSAKQLFQSVYLLSI